MSIATLKKKTLYKYNNSSVGKPQFSLNGGFRNQGFVGQTSLSRSLIRTPMKGNVLKGYGGLNGTYTQTNILPSEVVSLNIATYIKPSVTNTKTMIHQRHRWINRPLPFSVFKPKKIDACDFNIVKDKIVRSCYKVVTTTTPLIPQNVNCRIKVGMTTTFKCKTNIGTTSQGTKPNDGFKCT